MVSDWWTSWSSGPALAPKRTGRHHVRTSIPASTPRGGAVLGSRPVLIRPAHQYGAFTRVRRTCRRLAERGHRLIVPTSPLEQVSTHARHQGRLAERVVAYLLQNGKPGVGTEGPTVGDRP